MPLAEDIAGVNKSDKRDLIGSGINTAVTGIGLTVSRNLLLEKLKSGIYSLNLGIISGDSPLEEYLGIENLKSINPYLTKMFENYFSLYSPIGILGASAFTLGKALLINYLVRKIMGKWHLDEDTIKKYSNILGTGIDITANVITMYDIYSFSNSAIEKLVNLLGDKLKGESWDTYVSNLSEETVTRTQQLVKQYLQWAFSEGVFEKIKWDEISKGLSTVYDKFVPNINLGIQLPSFLSTLPAQYIFGTILNDVVLGAIFLSIFYGWKNKSKKYIAAGVIGGILYTLFRVI